MPNSLHHAKTPIAVRPNSNMNPPLSAGRSVRIVIGAMEGFEGTVAGRRSSRRVLLQLKGGVYVEIDEDCVDGATSNGQQTLSAF